MTGARKRDEARRVSRSLSLPAWCETNRPTAAWARKLSEVRLAIWNKFLVSDGHSPLKLIFRDIESHIKEYLAVLVQLAGPLSDEIAKDQAENYAN